MSELASDPQAKAAAMAEQYKAHLETAAVNEFVDVTNPQSMDDFNSYLEARPSQDANGKIHGPDGNFANPNADYDNFEYSSVNTDGTPGKSSQVINERIANETLADTAKDYESMSPSQLAKELAEAEVADDKTKFIEVDEILSNKVEGISASARGGLPEGDRMKAQEQIHDRLAKIREAEKARLLAEKEAKAKPVSAETDAPVADVKADSDESTPAEPVTEDEPTPADDGEKKDDAGSEGISDEELAALGGDKKDDGLEGLSSEELFALGKQARDEAVTKSDRMRSNNAAVNRLAKKLGLNDEEMASLQARLNQPIAEGETRPPARGKEDIEKLKPENIDAMYLSELNKYLNLEANRSRFNRHDAEVARDKAEQVLRKMAEQGGWSDEQLENQIKALNESVGLASEPEAPSDGEQPHPDYAGPVPNGMEIEMVEPDQVMKKGLRDRLRDRWHNAKTRTSAAVRGDVGTAFGPRNLERQEGMSRRKKIALSLGAVAGATLVVLLATKRIDINPFDNDIDHTIDLDPFNGDNQQVPGYALREHAKGEVPGAPKGTSYEVFRSAGVDHPTLNNIFDNPDDFLRQSEWIQAEIAKGRDPKEVEKQLLNFYDSVKK